jgi:tetratricopeptide (TPR) repeat protein
MRGGLPRAAFWFRYAFIVMSALAVASGAQLNRPPASSSTADQVSATVATHHEEAIRLNNLGTAYMVRQDIALALKQFQRASELDGHLIEAKLNQAIALLNLQKFEPARAILLRFVQDNPTNARAWYNLGLLYKAQAQFADALDAFSHASQLSPSDADTYYFVGLMLDEMQQEKEALHAFEKALELNPFHASAEYSSARAYQRLGDSENAKLHFERFQTLTERKLGTPLSLAYGDQGVLSLAAQSQSGANQSPASIAVKFVDVTKQMGLPAAGVQSESVSKTVMPHGACWLQLNESGLPYLLLANTGPEGHAALYRNTGAGKFQNVTEAAGLGGVKGAESCAAADYDNDGKTDIAFGFGDHIALYRNEGNEIFRDVTAAARLNGEHVPSQALLWVDYDHDGDVDLYAIGPPYADGSARNRLFRNNGNGTFTDWSEQSGLNLDGANSAALSDYNNDRAVDLLVTGPKTRVLTNPHEGKWTASEPWDGKMPSPSVGVAVADFNKNGWMDAVFSHGTVPALTAWENNAGRNFRPFNHGPETSDLAEAWGVVAFDYDNDGWIDIAAVARTREGKDVIRLYRNLGRQGFKDVTSQTGLDSVQLHDPRGLYAADFDNDGDYDLLITQGDGSVVLLRNDGGNKNHFVKIALKGLSDNKSAVGTKVEVFAGALWQKFEISGSGYLGQSSTDLLIGLGRNAQADVVRLLWPTGVPQDEIEIHSGQTAKIGEIDRRGSSCPLLFAWDGTRYRFISDMLGAGVLGHWVGPNERNIPRPTEYTKLEGMSPRMRDGKLSFRFMEPMEEVVYVDQVRLLAVDHPADTEVYPNEYFASNPPYPEYKVISSRDVRPPAGAWDGDGRNVLPLLAARDHQYVDGFQLLPFKGFTKPHTLELDLGEPYQGGPLKLLMHGYIEYFMATFMFAAYQAGIEPYAPYVEALDPSGRWIRVVDDMGFPAGLWRATIADLTGKLPNGTRRIRLTTNLQIYWDQILVDRTPDGEPFHSSEMPLVSAKLGFRGFPRAIERGSPGDLDYVYEQTSRTGPYTRPVGAYTRTGDVTDLLKRVDDRFVVFGSGDEVQLEFDPANLPPLPAGWKRDYFFFADGYEKDMDFYAADGLTVAPFPFHAMPSYPYGAAQKPSMWNSVSLDYLLDYNTRIFSGTDTGEYRFHFAPRARTTSGGKDK